MTITNRRIVEETDNDWYKTPYWGTKSLILNETFNGNILEPCCGSGEMSEVLKEINTNVISSDLIYRGYDGSSVKDFLSDIDYPLNIKYDNIITNPPFNLAEEIFTKAYKLSNEKVCLLLRTAFLESSSRYNNIFSNIPPSRIWVFSERLTMYKGDVTNAPKNGGTTSYSWFIWDKASTNNYSEIKWFPPGYKKLFKGIK
jgi:hypothetical protein